MNLSMAQSNVKTAKQGSAKGSSANNAPETDDPGGDGFLTGQLLIAMPTMSDPRFARSVICLCAHNAEGAMGIVLSRPIVRPSFDELLQQLEIKPVPSLRQIPMCSGGPVDAGRGFMLHTTDWTGEGSLTVNGTLALTATLDVLRVVAAGEGPRKCMLALGYAGWGPGQLDQELQDNAWLSTESEEGLIFDSAYDTKWRRAMGLMNIDPLLLSETAGHA
jgi:putative transcriptional regulator